jgi:hypothetical protein
MTVAHALLRAATALVSALASLVFVVARAQPVDNTLKKFLQNYQGTPATENDKTTRYFVAFGDLSGDGTPEVIVYLTGPWCGSGGCTALILARNDASYSIVTKITTTWPPIRVLTSTSHAWHDITVWVRGGGIIPGYEAKLRFDGKTYPGNPSMPPASRMTGKVAGRIVISGSEERTPLYP